MSNISREAQIYNALRAFVSSTTMPDETALSMPDLHDKWSPGVAYAADKVLRHNGGLYRVVTPHTSQAHQPPDAEGMLAIYRPVVQESTGTKEDPIPYLYGMDVHTGLYYVYQGALWRAKVDMLPCVWPPAEGNEWEAVQ